MFKKLIALVEALMLVSLFCIGFSTWSIIDPDGVTISTNGGMHTQDVTSVTLETVGIGYTGNSSQSQITNQTGFEYNLEGATAKFSKTTLTVEVKFHKDTLTALAYDQPYQLLFECKNDNAAVFDVFTTDTYLIAPTYATAYLKGFPNQVIQGSVVQKTSEKLASAFAVKSTSAPSLYNLVSRDVVDSNATATIVFTFEFTPIASVSSDYVKAICWSTYTLSFKIGAI